MPCTRTDASADIRLGTKINLEGVFLMATDKVIFGVYQVWVHQNPSTYLEGGIGEDGKSQALREKKCLFAHPTL